MLIAFATGFLALSYLPRFAPEGAFTLAGVTIYWTFWCSTAIILCDAAVTHLKGRSPLVTIAASRAQFARFLVAGALCGVFLDGTAQWLGKLWIYPYWSAALYGSTFVLGFCAYCLLLTETYLATKAAIRRWQPRTEPHRPFQHGLICGVAGTVLIMAGLLWAMSEYDRAGGYRFVISKPSAAHASFACFPVIFTGIWLALEFVLARQRKPPLLSSIAERDWGSVCAALIAGEAFGFLMETTNAPHRFWIYTNWPLQNVTIWGVPIVVLLTWPVQYLVFVSVFSILVAGEVWG